VLELSSEGRSQPEISKILQVSVATINTDMQYLRQEAKENIKRYIDEPLPLEYHKCLVGLDSILCKMSDIVNNAEPDSREVIQATSVKMQAYSMKIDLLSNATVIEKAVQFIDRNSRLTPQSKEVAVDNDSTELIKDNRQVRPKAR
jgi:hypothetical protein